MTSVILDLITVTGPIALAALGFAVIYRISGHMHFAYGGIWTLGTYIVGHGFEAGWGVPLSFAVSLVVSCVLAVASYLLYIRLTGQYTVVLVSFAIFTILVGLTQLIFGPGSLGYDSSRAFSGVWTIGGEYVSQVSAIQLGLALVISLLLAWCLGRTGVGLAARAVSESAELAEVTGIRTRTVTIGAYVAGTVIGCLSGLLHVIGLGSSLDSGEVLTLEILAVTILAGRVIVATFPTALFFGAILVAADVLAGPDFITMIGYAVLFLVLRLRPDGLFARDWTLPESRKAAVRADQQPPASTSELEESGTRV